MTIFGALILVVIAAPLVFLQAGLLDHVYLTTALAKILAAIPLAFSLRLPAHLSEMRSGAKSSLLAFALFVGVNLYAILAFSAPRVGVENALLAFAYNYSLLLFVVPYYWLGKRYGFPTALRSWAVLGLLLFFVVASDLMGLLQHIQNNLLWRDDMVAILAAEGEIKFDHIDTFIRASSFFKSPLEYGMFNVFVSAVALAWILNRRMGWLVLFIFLTAHVSVFITLSRTAILMHVVSFIVVGILSYKVCGRSRLVLKRLAAIVLLGTVSLAVVLSIGGPASSEPSATFVGVASNPTNGHMRAENWFYLLYGIWNSPLVSSLIGSGVVQNGTYGAYHAAVIDNTYIGALLTGGVLGTVLFLVFLTTVFWDGLRVLNSSSDDERPFTIGALAFFVAFLVGGLTENLMHILFYPLMALAFVRNYESGSITARSTILRLASHHSNP